LNEKVLMPAVEASIQIVAIKPGVVRLGIEAPPDVVILREEVQTRAARAGTAAAAARLDQHRFRCLVENRLKISREGLKILSRCLQNGMLAEANAVLSKIDDELLMLQERLAKEELRPTRQPAAKHGKALLVEDNANERELLATLLRASGVEVATAGDGADALDYLRNGGRPDVLLLDMGLPRCDGATMVRTLRSDPTYAGLKIFAVTGHAAEEFNLIRGPAGIDRWFLKPVNPEQLIGDLRRELGG
jgi:CheY-like chemotaxis protein/sRNA-binding carbon storage regulator CsrA